AIMRAISKYDIESSGAIIESPFGTMLNSVCNRFEMLNIPSFPFAHLLTFWGGIQHGFWAFSHNPIDYAKELDIPVLLTLGVLDDRVDVWEVEEIYANIEGYKKLHFFDEAEHELASEKYPDNWSQIVENFLYETHN
ncbi:MAG: hypothetical protein WBA23_22360, partial [Tunicatimonas sp.]|uniref:alpha/beta hydrolase family protein n=1 Tax=Tunicatimonas sp. TaxID=1940096 RepID=UPI003C74FA98